MDLENDFPSLQTSTEKQNILIAAASTEMFDGKAVIFFNSLLFYSIFF